MDNVLWQFRDMQAEADERFREYEEERWKREKEAEDRRRREDREHERMMLQMILQHGQQQQHQPTYSSS